VLGKAIRLTENVAHDVTPVRDTETADVCSVQRSMVMSKTLDWVRSTFDCYLGLS
jgi:hypothetical protein